MSRLIDENDIIKMLNTMDRYTSEELTLCDTDKTFPMNEVFIVDDVFEGLDELPSTQPERTEIIRCKDCNKASKCYGDVIMRSRGGGNIYCPLEFCSEAERRTDERPD